MYAGYQEQLELLNMEQRGIWITAVLCYVNGLELPEMDLPVRMMFSITKTNLDRDMAKWIDTVEKRRAAGILGGYAKARKSGLASASFCQTDAADYDNGNVSEYVTDNNDPAVFLSGSFQKKPEGSPREYSKRTKFKQACRGPERGTDYNKLLEQELLQQLSASEKGGDVSGHP